MTFTPGKFYISTPYAGGMPYILLCIDKEELFLRGDSVGVIIGPEHPGKVISQDELAGGWDLDWFGVTEDGEPVKRFRNDALDTAKNAVKDLPALLFVVEGPVIISTFIWGMWKNIVDEGNFRELTEND